MRDRKEERPDPDALCADILGWIAGDETLMRRFLDLSGLTVDNLRAASLEPGFQAGVLGFLMSHEPTLMAYCDARGVAPEHVAACWHRLEHPSYDENQP